MMKKTLFICMILFISYHVCAQENGDTKKIYDKIFIQGKESGGKSEHLPLDNDIARELLNNKLTDSYYLLTHFSGYSIHKAFIGITDEQQLQNSVITYLNNNLISDSTMQDFTGIFKTNNKFVPDTITMDEMLNIAVKYFYIKHINKDGHYVGKVCKGINGIKETEDARNPQLEDFCFSVIFSNYESEENNMYEELIDGVKDVYKLNLGTDKKEKLLRAQGAMYMYMRHNETLKNLLIKSYHEQKEDLPFVLISEKSPEQK